MKLKRVLVLSVIIVSLTFVAIAGQEETKIAFKGEGYFQVVYDPDWGYVYIPPGGFELLNVSHLGLSKVEWKLLVNPPAEPGDPYGCFTITGPNGSDSLEGIYNGFVLDMEAGEYDLEWLFTGGTGRFEGATGTGHTDGLVDFDSGLAQYEFEGEVAVPEED